MLREPCYHVCGYCFKEWFHVVSPKAPLDEWRMPCLQCVLKLGIDVVAEIEKREARAAKTKKAIPNDGGRAAPTLCVS
jgi:hypothetical protein